MHYVKKIELFLYDLKIFNTAREVPPEFSNQWYKELVTIESRYEDDVLAFKFPYIIVKNSEIEKYIKTAITEIKAKKEAIGKSFVDIKMKLFQESLKTESIGIPRSAIKDNVYVVKMKK